jgi:hypothetical protein
MVAFLQPNVFSISGRALTSHERAAANRMRNSVAAAIRACYPHLREKLALLRTRGVLAYDIGDAFDANREPIFVDDNFHVESTGNRLVSEAILKHLLPVLLDSSPFLEGARWSKADRPRNR